MNALTAEKLKESKEAANLTTEQIEKQREQWRERQRKYRERHPDRVKKSREDYIIRRAAQLLAKQEHQQEGV